MAQIYRDPDFFSFASLSRRLGITQSRIQDDYRTGHISKFLIDNMNTNSIPATKKRIAKLMPLLNKYARENIDKSPINILAVPSDYNIVKLNDAQVQFLSDNIYSNSIFKYWLDVNGLDINTIRIVIPRSEAEQYEKYLKNIQSQGTDSFHIDLNAHVVSIREEFKCKPISCYNCDNHECRNRLAHEISMNYGYNTPYRVNLTDIGIAMGCPEPTMARNKEDKDQMKKYIREKNVIKSQVRRWIAEHKKCEHAK